MQLTDFFVKGYYSDILNTDILAEFDNYKFVNCQENSSMHITDVIWGDVANFDNQRIVTRCFAGVVATSDEGQSRRRYQYEFRLHLHGSP